MTYKNIDFTEFTEVSGTKITIDQLYRMNHRYSWVKENLKESDEIIELCCGCGQGIKMLTDKVSKYYGTDITENLLNKAKNLNNQKAELTLSEANYYLQNFKENSIDAVIILEAIYYFESINEIFTNITKILKEKGKLFLCWPNPDFPGFHRSDHSFLYPTYDEIIKISKEHDLTVNKFFGFRKYKFSLKTFLKTKIKKIASKLNLIPSKMSAKIILKKIFEGSMIEMPKSLNYININDDSFYPLDEEGKSQPMVFYIILEK